MRKQDKEKERKKENYRKLQEIIGNIKDISTSWKNSKRFYQRDRNQRSNNRLLHFNLITERNTHSLYRL